MLQCTIRILFLTSPVYMNLQGYKKFPAVGQGMVGLDSNVFM